MTDKPFGVNLTFLPVDQYRRTIRDISKAIIEGGVKIVETAGNNPQSAAGARRKTASR